NYLTKAFDFSGSAVSVDVTISPDLFGQESAKKRAAAARVTASHNDVEVAALQVSVAIARAYVQRATLARRLALIDTSIAQASELDRVIRIRNREGAANKVEVGLQSIRLRQLQAERSRISEALDQTRTALAYLVGEESPSFDVAPADLSLFTTPDIPVPSPLQLIERRPDVRAAEARIRAANGDVAAARRAFYPSLDLSIGGAFQAGQGSPVSLIGNIGASVLATIFGRNRLGGQLDYTAAQQREAVSVYRAALLNAQRAVEDALSAIRHSDERERLLTAVEVEAQTTEKLARQQYLEGAEDLQHLLDAQDLRVSVQDARALARQERIEGLIQLYAATGPS
ncbi:MAG: TolC family protein, partial [Sphingomonas sp.]|uniref:TolC family protein n=1 Tax=Sphingomonas sp. TaxID=28214 RepID=UPI003F814F9D